MSSATSSFLRQGQLALSKGDHRSALGAYLQAFVETPDAVAVQRGLVRVLGITKGYQLPKAVTDYLAEAALKNQLDVQALATALNNQLDNSAALHQLLDKYSAEPTSKIDLGKYQDAFDEVLTDKLLLLVLNQATAISPHIEQLVTYLRKHALMERVYGGPATGGLWHMFPGVLAACANQCFHTEYVFDFDAAEVDLLAALEQKFTDNAAAMEPEDCVALAMYQPLLARLFELGDTVVSAVDASVPNWPAWATGVWVEQAQLPYAETKLADALPAFTRIDPGLSAEVQQQYERFPYPRWQSANISDAPISLKAMLGQHLHATMQPQLPDGPVSTLFAGCGTGQQVVQMASSISMSAVRAVDLSRTSLAHAQRKSAELGLETIEYGQADILAINNWQEAYDFIVCTGVLHHMADPALALKSLLAVSKPHTVFFLALYSERARSHVIAAREHIKKQAIPDTIEGIRLLRKHVRTLPGGHPMHRVAGSREFYSASGLHDLVFNRHELRFTPLELKALLEENELTFAGFHMDGAEHKLLYQNRFPDDPAMTNLDNWDKLEMETPELFTKMMQFWCYRT